MRLERTNTLLVWAIVLVNLYIIAMPFTPALRFWYTTHYTHKAQQLKQSISSPNISNNAGVSESGNRLIVPSMLLDSQIFEGRYQNTLSKGLWRLPQSSTPAKGGNTVIVGHRFTYTNPEGVFYSLNKVSVGDEIGVIWSGKKYIYSVKQVEIVNPNDVSVQQPTKNSTLTLYTCTPLWWPKNRLVVIAGLEQS